MAYNRDKWFIDPVWQALISPESDDLFCAYGCSPLLWTLKPRVNNLPSQFSCAIMRSALALSNKAEGEIVGPGLKVIRSWFRFFRHNLDLTSPLCISCTEQLNFLYPTRQRSIADLC